MQFSKETIDKIEGRADVFEVLKEFITFKKESTGYYGKCPMCNKEGKGKGLKFSPAKKIYKCFSCEFGGNNAVHFLMNAKNKTYPEALKYLADMYNILPDDETPKPKQTKAQKLGKPSPKDLKSFRTLQLEMSGLEETDQKAMVFVDDNTKKHVDIYQEGTRDQYGQIVHGDDLIIWYYDLEGKPVLYKKNEKSTKMEHLFRVRWQNPDIHLDKYGRAMKYSSPYGSGSHIYIPEPVRRAFAAKQQHQRLFIQEGEKKADKACKHGIFSVGIMGIHNIANKGQLPHEFQHIIKNLGIKEVVFLVDSDFDQLSHNLKPGDSADQRPRSFFRAVCNFRDYFKTFTNMGIYLEIYFGHVKLNDKNDKGIDDLLVNQLKGRENELFNDIDAALKEKSGEGEFVQLYKISTTAETKLIEIWNLDSAQKFCEKHITALKQLNEFKINNIKWRYNAKDELELAQPLLPDELYWEKDEWEDKNGKKRYRYEFDYENAYNFLRNRGYGRIMMADGKYQFCHTENNIVIIVDAGKIKDYVMKITREIAPKDIRNMLFRGGKMYLGPDSLSNLDFIYPEFDKPNRFEQSIYFKNKFWKITNEGITELPLASLESYIWSDKVINYEVTLEKPLVQITPLTPELLKKFNEQNQQLFTDFVGQYFIGDGFELSERAEKSSFVKFLWNTGEFYWSKLTYDANRNVIADTRTIAEKFETVLHFLSKMCAIGYLLHRYNNKSHAKAVIAMDGKLSEVGASNGRTGKSLVGFALEHCVPQVYIGGKQRNLTEDKFIFEEVSEKTCNIFIDDVRANVDFEFFFPFLGGKANIEKKAIGKFTLPDELKPKLYISTNHAINGDSDSFIDRQYVILFSDYWSSKWKPEQEFGIQLFEEWDFEQWNLFYNFIAQCLHFYLKYGIVTPPSERIELRRLRQEIGEEFFSWADEYFGVNTEGSKTRATSNIDTRIARGELKDNFLARVPSFQKYYTPNVFKKKFKKWCAFNRLVFNPNTFDKEGTPGADDKTGGIEYFTVSNKTEL